jgi:hypothetical protein
VRRRSGSPEIRQEDVMAWYEDRECIVCKKKIGRLHFWSDKPKIVDSKGDCTEWKKLDEGQIASLLEGHHVVCYSCYCDRLQDLLRMIGAQAAGA